MSKVSAANIAANRANAKRSTGPRTPEGKARSSQNARKHIFNPTSFPVVRLEEIDEVDRLRADAIAAYQPVNSQETFAVERIVLAQQALLRAERLHSGIFTICLNETVTDDGRPITAINPILVNDDFQICRAQNRNFLLAEARSAWRPNAFEERLERLGKSATPGPDRSPDARAFQVSRWRGGRYAWGRYRQSASEGDIFWVTRRCPCDPFTQNDAGGTPAPKLL
jgi:hypothetical protein